MSEFAPQISGHPDRHVPSDMLDTTISYTLKESPIHGATFYFKTVNASSFVTEVAVFSNGLPCGILQVVGAEGGRQNRQLGNTYRVYIPPEFFRAGENTLRIRKLGHPYCRSDFNYCSLTLDWIELVALTGDIRPNRHFARSMTPATRPFDPRPTASTAEP